MEMNLTQNQIKRVNAIREYYNVMWLSKICTCDGKFIRKGIYNGIEVPNNNYRVTWKFAKQERPNSYS